MPIGEASEQQVDMDDVLDGLYQRALDMARIQATQGILPRFHLKVMGRQDVYWIHAGREGRCMSSLSFEGPAGSFCSDERLRSRQLTPQESIGGSVLV